MPLDPTNSDAAFSRNVSELVKAGHDQKQALAIAYRVRGEKKKVGAKKQAARKPGVRKSG